MERMKFLERWSFFRKPQLVEAALIEESTAGTVIQFINLANVSQMNGRALRHFRYHRNALRPAKFMQSHRKLPSHGGIRDTQR